MLHVAAALEAGCTTLASFDDRQRKLAARVGLKVIPAVRPHPAVTVPGPSAARVAEGELRKAGTPIPANDAWIAALARQHGLAVLSNDVHFVLVPGLRRIPF